MPHRFIGDFSLKEKLICITEENLLHQINKVLHLEVNEEIILSDGKGNEVVGMIGKLSPKSIEVELLKKQINKNDPPKQVVLYCALLKADHFEWVLQKGTEVGVSEFVPLVTARTIKKGLNIKRCELIIREAAEQSGRGILPVLRNETRFLDALKDASKNNQNYFCNFGGKLLKVNQSAQRVGVFIGPEGGWEANEVEIAQKYHLEAVSLGSLTMRAETAAIIASYLINH